MSKWILASMFGILALSASASAAEPIDVKALHDKFVQAFNTRDWAGLKAQMSDDIVFHRASGDTAFVGPDAVIGRFSETIGNPGQWNVKFAILNSDSSFTGKDGRVVERGDFAVTAGGDSSSCYRGSYMMTWVQAGSGWKLQLLGWQDVETNIKNCQ